VPADLAVGVSHLELVPGDPDEIEFQLAPRLAAFGGGMSEAAARLRSLDLGGWQGLASDAFRAVLGDQPARYETAGASFSLAAAALRSYAQVLREAQQEALRAVAGFEQAQAQTRAWQLQWDHHEQATRAAADPAALAASRPPDADPGEDGRNAALRLLGGARAGVDAQARSTAAALARAAEDAPDEPGLLEAVLDGIGDFFGGAWDQGAEIVGGAWDSVTGLLTDPLGWVDDTWDNFYDHVAFWNWDTFLGTWKEFGKDFLAWDEWEKNWRRALGMVVVNVAVTAGTVGVGTLLKRFLLRGRRDDGDSGSGQGPPPQRQPTPEERRRQFPPPQGAPGYDRVHRTPRSDRHILGGEYYMRGGHRPGTGFPGTTEFPDGWSDQQILDAVDEAAQNPVREMERTERVPGTVRWSYIGEANGLRLLVVLDQQGRVVTAHPLDGQPGTFTNPPQPEAPPPGVERPKPIYTRPDPATGTPGYWTYERADGTRVFTDQQGRPFQPPGTVPTPTTPGGDPNGGD